MEAKREQAMVGLFVLVVAGLLLITVFTLTGAFSHAGNAYRTYVKFAAGIEPGATVRYAGGPKVGRVERVRSDPNNPARMEIAFRVTPDTPVKTDSIAKVASLSPLGENFLEILPGSLTAPAAPSGTVLKSTEYTSFDEVTSKLNEIAPVAEDLLKNLNGRVTELKETIARVNDLLDQRNRANISASLGHVRGMLEEDRPKIKSTLTHMDTASAKLPALLDDFKKTVAEAKDAIEHIDATITENRPDLRKSIIELRNTLASAESLTAQLDRTLDANGENIDEMLENMRHITENLKAFTDTIKTRPYTLIRASNPPAREPGGKGRP